MATRSDPSSLAASRTGTEWVFPLADLTWELFAGRDELRGADEGAPGRGGWRFRRSATHVHHGIDLQAAIRHPVVAVEAGVARYQAASVNPGRWPFNTAGHRVCLIGCVGAAYLYFHLGTDHDRTLDAFPPGIRSGDIVAVEAGDVLGYTGHTGGSAASGSRIPSRSAHLHFEYHPDGPDGVDVNPARLFEHLVTGGGLRP